MNTLEICCVRFAAVSRLARGGISVAGGGRGSLDAYSLFSLLDMFYLFLVEVTISFFMGSWKIVV